MFDENNEQVHDLISISKAVEVQDVLAPVKLTDEQNDLYEGVMFPSRKQNGMGLKAEDFSKTIESIVALSGQINNMYAVLGYIVTNAGDLEDLDPQDLQSSVMGFVQTVKSTHDEKTYREFSKAFLTSLNNGQYHTIVDSKRFKGGKDILFSGIPATSGEGAYLSSGVSINGSTIRSSIHSKDNGAYQDLRMQHYEADLAKKAMSVADQLTEILFGEKQDYSNAQKWKKAQLGLDYNWPQLDRIFAREFGFEIGIFTGLEHKQALTRNFQVLLMALPHKNVLQAYSEYSRDVQYKKENPDSTIEPKEPNLQEAITPEALKMDFRISASLAINLPREYVQYISQNTEDDLNLYSLSNWVTQWSRLYLRPKGARTQGGGGVRYKRLPRYIVPPSRNEVLLKHRDDQKLPKDPGRVNEDRITVNPRGLLTYYPGTPDQDFSNAKAYEQALEETLKECYAVGAPLSDSKTLISKVFEIDKGDFLAERRIQDKKKDLGKFKGSLLAFNWDYNTVLTAGVGNPFTQVATDLNGSTTPSALAIADYLGFDFAQEGERTQSKSFNRSVNYLIPGTDLGNQNETFDTDNIPTEINAAGAYFLRDKTLMKLLDAYVFLLRKEKVPKLQDLIKESMQELGHESLANAELDRSLYSKAIDETGTLKDPEGNEKDALIRLLTDVMVDAAGFPGSNLYSIVSEEVGAANAAVEMRDHQSYFRQASSTMADFGNLYTYTGGLVFKKVCEAITKVNPKDLVAPLEEYDPVIDGHAIPFTDVSQTIMPLAFMFSKYVPNAMDIFEKAEQEAEGYTPDDSIDVSDLQMPGIAEGAQVFPHQVKGHKSLRRRPKHAVLDVHPGGGKTITVLLDIGNLAREEPGLKFCVICPDKLVANWCEDLAKITKGSWNAIPVVGDSFKTWGEERLTDMIQNAPPNTITVVGLEFLKSAQQEISYGPRKIKVYGGTEFIKQQGFDYFALDESHKAKQFNPHSGKTSAVHITVKQLFTSASAKYTRLATGTLIHGVLQDVVGQAALFSAHIFRTPNDFDIDASAPDGAIRVRSKFGQHASVITIKRKEWAFMLPSPIDTFLEVDLLDPQDIGSQTHVQVYNALLKQTIEDLQDHVKKAQAGKVGGVPSEAEADDLDDHSADDLDIDEDDELSDINPAVFRYYMQRLEQLITDPEGDLAFQEAAKAAGIESFVSPKIKSVIERLDRHFQVVQYDEGRLGESGAFITKWEMGMKNKELEVVEYNGKHYMRRRQEDGIVSSKRRVIDEPSTIPPDQDKENWKEEAKGKVLIFCRYTRTTDAIFRNLPPKYKSVARRFHGQADNKWQALEDFKTDPDVKILVANEQAIVEGHNLQMASRIIRVETPWSPGDYEQSTARIFRPDPSAAQVEDGKPGDMRREVIYIDWLMTQGTMEVAKVARLMWKTVEKTKFDEKGNARYDEVMGINLDKIKMDIKTLLSVSADGVESFTDHFRAKGTLNNIEAQEFHEMRKTTVASLQDLPQTDPLPDFRVLDAVPILENQRIPDPDGFGLERFLDWYGSKMDKMFDGDIKAQEQLSQEQLDGMLRNLPVRTEFGTGVIVGFRVNMVTSGDGTKHIHLKQPVTSIKVRYNSNDELGNVNPRKLFVAGDVTQKDFDKFFRTNKPWGTEAERKRIEKEVLENERKRRKQEQEAAKAAKKVKKKVAQEKSRTEKANQRRKNVKKGRPINENVSRRVKKLDPITPDGSIKLDKDGEPSRDMKIKIIPTVYNGFLALHVRASDPDAKDLKQLGFKSFGEFAYCEFKNYRMYDKALDYIEGKFQLDRPSVKRLNLAMDTFEERKRMGFDIALGMKIQSELPNFWRTRHRELQDKKTIKVYPVIMPDRLRLTVDMRTNPIMKRHLGKTMPGAGAGGKWKLHEGMAIFFAVNKTNAKAKLKELIKAGYEITNMDAVLKAISELVVKRTREHDQEVKKRGGA
jgi:hypothetical protein